MAIISDLDGLYHNYDIFGRLIIMVDSVLKKKALQMASDDFNPKNGGNNNRLVKSDKIRDISAHTNNTALMDNLQYLRENQYSQDLLVQDVSASLPLSNGSYNDSLYSNHEFSNNRPKGTRSYPFSHNRHNSLNATPPEIPLPPLPKDAIEVSPDVRAVRAAASVNTSLNAPHVFPPPIPLSSVYNTEGSRNLSQQQQQQQQQQPYPTKGPLPPSSSITNRPAFPLPHTSFSSSSNTLPYQYQQYAPPPPAYYTPPPQAQITNPPVQFSICGLKNYGSTCYLNSLIQCLYNARTFMGLFRMNEYQRYVQPVSNDNIHPQVFLSYALASLVKTITNNGGSTVAPSRFLKYLDNLSDASFVINNQQDVQEILLLILNRLHDELCKTELTIYEFPRTIVMHSNSKEYKDWFEQKVSKEGLSPINAFFEGQLESNLQCQICGFESKTFSSFNVLSLNIPQMKYQRSMIELTECIKFFTQSELLTGENSWDCPRCKNMKEEDLKKMEENGVKENITPSISPVEKIFEKKNKNIFKKMTSRNKSSSPSRPSSSNDKKKHHNKQQSQNVDPNRAAIKSLRFISLPSYLIIHLSRFDYMQRKLHTPIIYPLILEIPVYDQIPSSPPSPSMSNSDFNSFSNGFVEARTTRYKLNSIINHSGPNITSGHYTAVVNKSSHLHSPFWCFFDDERVAYNVTHGDLARGIKSLQSDEVYVLFYERIKND
ncbi:hypothetical protein PACTADRAFT_81322 [Pachysolen tannophilus NRRL Y-2460]|uniref:Ubiquitin carboxyl-terminal hydrolase n=1 Tax=Pachysolen tannophilus NRRL Y-2460 TaxID=669874 RepID=A0A1E4TSP4_PACTA|nr:hypothetical protein PACTADRAFT_81322 [Pachysolen tannophilus NRRL Y-2460]